MSSTCRSCGAPIDWAVTAAGKRMPLDVERRDDGNVTFDPDGTARVVPVGKGSRVSHFATCPNAQSHRRKR